MKQLIKIYCTMLLGKSISKIIYLLLLILSSLIIVFSSNIIDDNGKNSIKLIHADSLNHKSELLFKLGFPNSRVLNGGLTFSNDTSEYLFFCNPSVGKSINIFSSNAQVEYIIPLNEIFQKGEEIRDIQILSFDTIFVVSQRTNNIYIINSLGQIWRTINLEHMLIYDNIKYEVIPSFKHNFYYKGSLYFGLVIKDYPRKTYSNKLEMLQSNLKLESKSPFICKINGIFNDSLSIEFGLFGFLSNFYDSSYYLNDFRVYYPIENKLILTSIYSDMVFVVNIFNLKLENQHKLSSNYSKINIVPIKLDQHINNPGNYNQALVQQGHIDVVHFCSEDKRFYIKVRHDRDSLMIINDKFPFSIITLDKNFRTLFESQILDQNYVCNPVFISNKILIPDNSPIKNNYDRNRFKYSVFTF